MTNGKLAVSEMSELLGDDGKLDITWLFLLNNKIVIDRLHIHMLYNNSIHLCYCDIFTFIYQYYHNEKIIESWLM